MPFQVPIRSLVASPTSDRINIKMAKDAKNAAEYASFLEIADGRGLVMEAFNPSVAPAGHVATFRWDKKKGGSVQDTGNIEPSVHHSKDLMAKLHAFICSYGLIKNTRDGARVPGCFLVVGRHTDKVHLTQLRATNIVAINKPKPKLKTVVKKFSTPAPEPVVSEPVVPTVLPTPILMQESQPVKARVKGPRGLTALLVQVARKVGMSNTMIRIMLDEELAS